MIVARERESLKDSESLKYEVFRERESTKKLLECKLRRLKKSLVKLQNERIEKPSMTRKVFSNEMLK